MASLVDSKVVEEGKKEEEVALTLGLSNGRFYQLTLAKGDGGIRFVGRQLIMFGERGLEEMNCKHGVILYGRRCISCGRERMAKLQHMQIEDRVEVQNIILTIGFQTIIFINVPLGKGRALLWLLLCCRKWLGRFWIMITYEEVRDEL